MLSDFPQCRRSSTVCSQKNHECMWNYVEQKPGTMICKCFDQLKISPMVLHCILRNYLYLYPYKVQLVQKLKFTDHQHLNYSIQIQMKIANLFLNWLRVTKLISISTDLLISKTVRFGDWRNLGIFVHTHCISSNELPAVM